VNPSLEFFAFEDTRDLALAVGSILKIDVRPIHVHRFPDGESLVRAGSQGASRAWVFRSLSNPNDKLFEVLLAADALRRQGIAKVALAAPYLGYMRQDQIFHPGEAVSQRVVARLLDSAFDGILTVEAHLHRIQSLSEIFTCRADSVSASGPIAEWLRQRSRPEIVIGPDSESEPWIRSIARKAGIDWMLASKTRYSDDQVRIDVPAIPPGVRAAWIVDDIASSGTTLEVLVRILKQRGLQRVGAIVVHALLNDETCARLSRAGLDQLVSTNSTTHPSNEISLAPLLAREIAREADLPEVS
jgi:ribose-phosphate pyrophosphokinase